MKLSLFLLILLLSPLKSFSEDRLYDGPVQWNEFRKHVLEEEKAQEIKGLSYMISGAVAAVGGTVGYFHSEEIFSQTLFAITSNVGLAAIGVGASYYWAGSETSSFYYALEGSSLSLAQKNEVLQRYLLKQNELRENRRWIRVATHALIAAVNIYSASQSEDEDMRGLFYFLGGANAVLAISYSF